MIIFQSLNNFAMAEYTRSKIFHPVFGYPGPIPENQLPTKLDLYNHYLLRNENSKSTRDDIAKELTEVIVRIYEKSSIPTISKIKIKQYINSCVIERAKYHGKISKTSNNLTVSRILFPNSMFCSISQVANLRLKKVNDFALLVKRYQCARGHFSLISETLGNYLYLAWIARPLPKIL